MEPDTEVLSSDWPNWIKFLKQGMTSDLSLYLSENRPRLESYLCLIIVDGAERLLHSYECDQRCMEADRDYINKWIPTSRLIDRLLRKGPAKIGDCDLLRFLTATWQLRLVVQQYDELIDTGELAAVWAEAGMLSDTICAEEMRQHEIENCKTVILAWRDLELRIALTIGRRIRATRNMAAHRLRKPMTALRDLAAKGVKKEHQLWTRAEKAFHTEVFNIACLPNLLPAFSTHFQAVGKLRLESRQAEGLTVTEEDVISTYEGIVRAIQEGDHSTIVSAYTHHFNQIAKMIGLDCEANEALKV